MTYCDGKLLQHTFPTPGLWNLSGWPLAFLLTYIYNELSACLPVWEMGVYRTHTFNLWSIQTNDLKDLYSSLPSLVGSVSELCDWDIRPGRPVGQEYDSRHECALVSSRYPSSYDFTCCHDIKPQQPTNLHNIDVHISSSLATRRRAGGGNRPSPI